MFTWNMAPVISFHFFYVLLSAPSLHIISPLRYISCGGINSSGSIEINVNAFIFTSQECSRRFFSSCVAPASLIITSVIQERIGRFSLFIVFYHHTA